MTTDPAGSEDGTLVSMLAKVDTQMRFVREKEAGFVEAMEQAPTLGLNAAHTDAHTASVDAALQGLAMMEDAQSFLAQVCIALLPMMVCCNFFHAVGTFDPENNHAELHKVNRTHTSLADDEYMDVMCAPVR